MDFPGWDGFLGSRASLMFDLVVVAMVVVVAIMGWSIREVCHRRKFLLHKRVQITLAVLLGITIVAFEVDVRLFGWEDRAAGELGGTVSGQIWMMLYVHLFFAVTTILLWPVVILLALRRFPLPPEAGQHSSFHRRWGWLAVGDMLLTSISGWLFYWFAFVG